MAQQVRSEMVGSIISVSVTPGQQITPADVLLLLESMKMEIPVHSEAAGTVARVLVEAGDVVQEGDLLVELD